MRLLGRGKRKTLLGCDTEFGVMHERIEIIAFSDWMAVAGTWGHVATSSALLAGFLDSATPGPHVQNDEVTWEVPLAAGTWKLVLIHTRDTDRGIYTLTAEGASIGTIDGYNGSAAFNTRSELTGLVIAQGGVKTLSMKMATKNASSSGYRGTPQLITLVKTA